MVLIINMHYHILNVKNTIAFDLWCIRFGVYSSFRMFAMASGIERGLPGIGGRSEEIREWNWEPLVKQNSKKQSDRNHAVNFRGVCQNTTALSHSSVHPQSPHRTGPNRSCSHTASQTGSPSKRELESRGHWSTCPPTRGNVSPVSKC